MPALVIRFVGHILIVLAHVVNSFLSGKFDVFLFCEIFIVGSQKSFNVLIGTMQDGYSEMGHFCLQSCFCL